ncbi:MAG TPA: class I SAM-dependent methyltransferase [Bacteroidales bacterium]|nr:class I SAM-dependent methyltransferase [Bacteroidales bacterium]HRZ49350.1 class I SAM-dependent methyltransferase [Bacteroidales bacterium]
MEDSDPHEQQIRTAAASLVRRHQKQIQQVIREREIAQYQGEGVICPVCGSHFSEFAPVYQGRLPGDQAGNVRVLADHARCPNCQSQQRQRLLWLYLHKKLQLFDGQHKSVLEIAPELPFFRLFSQSDSIDYYPCDKFPQQLKYTDFPGDIVEADLCALPWPDSVFDMILCSHVLEHVTDDHQALRELYRVLKSTGLLLIQAPVSYDLESTLEDSGNSTPEQRETLYGQQDHYRRYGRDIEKRIQRAGFSADTFDCRKNYTPDEIILFGLDPWEKIYLCTK